MVIISKIDFCCLDVESFGMILSIYRTVLENCQPLVCIWMWCPLYDEEILSTVSKMRIFSPLHPTYKQMLQVIVTVAFRYFEKPKSQKHCIFIQANVLCICWNVEDPVRQGMLIKSWCTTRMNTALCRWDGGGGPCLLCWPWWLQRGISTTPLQTFLATGFVAVPGSSMIAYVVSYISKQRRNWSSPVISTVRE